MAKRFKWVAFSHDWSYEVGSETTFTTKDGCYNDMRTAVLNKMRWNTEYNEDFADGTDAISYKVWFEQGMIVHQSFSGTYVYLIVNEDENPTYYDVFSDEMVKRLQGIDMIDWAGVETIKSYQAHHKEQMEKKSNPTVINLNKNNVSVEDIKRAKQVLIDNGIEEDESDVVLQAIGYTLLDTELYPYPQCEEYRN